jgi:hypothetical protein
MSDEEEDFTASKLVMEVGRGELDTQLTDKIEQVVRLMRVEALRNGKGAKGEVKLTIKLSAALNGEDELLIGVDYAIDRKEPKPTNRTDCYFATRSGGLSHSPPDAEVDGPLFGGANPKHAN